MPPTRNDLCKIDDQTNRKIDAKIVPKINGNPKFLQISLDFRCYRLSKDLANFWEIPKSCQLPGVRRLQPLHDGVAFSWVERQIEAVVVMGADLGNQ